MNHPIKKFFYHLVSQNTYGPFLGWGRELGRYQLAQLAMVQVQGVIRFGLNTAPECSAVD